MAHSKDHLSPLFHKVFSEQPFFCNFEKLIFNKLSLILVTILQGYQPLPIFFNYHRFFLLNKAAYVLFGKGLEEVWIVRVVVGVLVLVVL